jgi:hypothetical protein
LHDSVATTRRSDVLGQADSTGESGVGVLGFVREVTDVHGFAVSGVETGS